MRTCTLLLFPLFVSLSSAQWTPTGGPGVGGVNVLFQHGGIIEAGTNIEGVYRSSDNGTTWAPANSGLDNASVRSLGSNTTYLFAGVDFDDNGHGGVYRMPLAGTQWTPVNTGISNQTISALLTDGSTLYVGTIGQGVYKSTNNGDTWVLSNTGMGNEVVSSIVKSGTVLFAAGSNNLYRSDDNGNTWIFTNGGQFFQIFSMAVSGNFIYAGGFQGLIRSTDNGNTWSNRIDILIISSVTHLSGFAVKGSTVFASTSIGPGAGVIKSTNNGLTWSFANSGIETVSLNTILTASGLLIAGGTEKGVLISANNGGTWTQSNSGLPPGGNIRFLLDVGDTVFAGTGGDGLYRTSDDGVTWTHSDTDPDGALQNAIVRYLTNDDGSLFAAAVYEGVFLSTDGGASWERRSNGLPAAELALSLAASGGNIMVGTTSGIFYSSDMGLTWNPTNITNATVDELAADSGFAYANVITGFTTGGIYRSSNNGVTWNAVLTSLVETPVGLAALGQRVYSGCFCSSGVRSTDFGSSWLSYTISGTDGIFVLHPTGSVVYAGTGVSSENIYRSTDFGATYLPFNEGLEPLTAVEALTTANGFLFAGTEDKGVWKRFVSESIPCDSIDLFQARCQPGGVIQARVVLLNSTQYEGEVVTFDVDGTDYPVTIVSNRVSSKAQLQITPGVGPHTIALVDPAGCFDPISLSCSATTASGEEWFWDSDITFSEGAGNTIPEATELFENYPDPFNPSTTIRYALSGPAHVTLRIFSAEGSLVTTLVDETQSAGFHQIVWNGSNDRDQRVSSGLYFCRMTAGNFVATRKMLLVK